MEVIMRKFMERIVLSSAMLLFMLALTACGKINTIDKYIVANEPYAQQSEIEKASQQDHLSVGKSVYASVYFIESPKGMKYTGKWFVDDIEMKSETQETITDKSGVIVYTLDADKVKKGTLKFEVVYRDDVLCSKELAVQ
jgi:hypothetical protein